MSCSRRRRRARDGRCRRHILDTPGVADVHDLHAWSITSGSTSCRHTSSWNRARSRRAYSISYASACRVTRHRASTSSSSREQAATRGGIPPVRSSWNRAGTTAVTAAMTIRTLPWLLSWSPPLAVREPRPRSPRAPPQSQNGAGAKAGVGGMVTAGPALPGREDPPNGVCPAPWTVRAGLRLSRRDRGRADHDGGRWDVLRGAAAGNYIGLVACVASFRSCASSDHDGDRIIDIPRCRAASDSRAVHDGK